MTADPAVVARAERIASVAYDRDSLNWRLLCAVALDVLLEQQAADRWAAVRAIGDQRQLVSVPTEPPVVAPHLGTSGEG